MVTANKSVKLTASFLVIVALLSLHRYADGATSLEAQKQALDVIADFADRFCYKMPLTGEGSQVELTGEGKAELNELIKKIVGLKVEGAAKYLSGEYKGVLHKDLIKALEDNATCRRTIWDDLKNKLIPGAQTTITSEPTEALVSCQLIKNTDRSAKDGRYKLSRADRSTYDAYCDMTDDGEG